MKTERQRQKDVENQIQNLKIRVENRYYQQNPSKSKSPLKKKTKLSKIKQLKKHQKNLKKILRGHYGINVNQMYLAKQDRKIQRDSILLKQNIKEIYLESNLKFTKKDKEIKNFRTKRLKKGERCFCFEINEYWKLRKSLDKIEREQIGKKRRIRRRPRGCKHQHKTRSRLGRSLDFSYRDKIMEEGEEEKSSESGKKFEKKIFLKKKNRRSELINISIDEDLGRIRPEDVKMSQSSVDNGKEENDDFNEDNEGFEEIKSNLSDSVENSLNNENYEKKKIDVKISKKESLISVLSTEREVNVAKSMKKAKTLKIKKINFGPLSQKNKFIKMFKSPKIDVEYSKVRKRPFLIKKSDENFSRKNEDESKISFSESSRLHDSDIKTSKYSLIAQKSKSGKKGKQAQFFGNSITDNLQVMDEVIGLGSEAEGVFLKNQDLNYKSEVFGYCEKEAGRGSDYPL